MGADGDVDGIDSHLLPESIHIPMVQVFREGLFSEATRRPLLRVVIFVVAVVNNLLVVNIYLFIFSFAAFIFLASSSSST